MAFLAILFMTSCEQNIVLQPAFDWLDHRSSPYALEAFSSEDEEFVSRTFVYSPVGLEMQDAFLVENPEITAFFESHGVLDYRSMTKIISVCYHRRANNLEMKLEDLLKEKWE